MPGIPTLTFARFGTIPVLAQNVPMLFHVFSSTDQRAFIDKLQAFRAEVETKGDDAEFLKGMGGITATQPDFASAKAALLDSCNWQLSMCFRYSTPTRIAEAVPYLEEAIAYHTRQHPGKVDDTPEMYLGVALHKQPGQEEAAIAHFRAAYDSSPEIGMQHNTQLWSRACFSRLLRRLGKIEEAKEQEDEIRDWLHWHPYGMPPSEFRALVTDPEHEGTNYILEHPSVQNMFSNMVEIAPGMVMHFG
ncbi:hypothetical protein MVEN_01791100 [Mycena venus]|uniref:Uncharacterized protein n=1 Tax=Mycena venus TaxID=2733690 RepID=A0A8H6XIW0_9AGAR|nr:hypothetical protein MVEN_01791100 [Mycena venus]